MKLQRIRVEQFKQFRQPFEIGDLEPGLNLFTGANEAGKSTLVAAIRAAFFERYRSSSVEELRPWGDSSASPSVALEFSIGSRSYHLEKQFLGKKRCRLLTPGLELDGVAAEDHLAELLGFQHPGKGASRAEHWGIPGLLWIQQGRAQDIHEPVGHAADHLRHALNASLGEIASSEGDAVLAQVEALRNELLTAATNKPREAFRKVLDQVAGLEAELQDLDADIAAYREQVDRLAILRQEHAADEAGQPWVHFRQQEQDALSRLEDIHRNEDLQQADQQTLAQLDTQIKLLRDRLQGFADEAQALTLRRTTWEQAQHACQAREALVAQWQGQTQTAQGRYQQAQATLKLARQAATWQELCRQEQELQRRLEAGKTALARAEAEQARLTALQTRLAATHLDDQDLDSLRTQHRELSELRIRMDAVATRLLFVLEPGNQLRIGTESVMGSGERLLTEPTRLHLPGLGRLDIHPGGADLAQLQGREQALAQRHAALLQRLGLDDLEAAEARQREQHRLQADLRNAQAALQAHAPKGMPALQVEVQQDMARHQSVTQALAALPAGADLPTELPPVSQAETAEESARQSLEQARQGLDQARLAAANAQASRTAMERELAEAQTRMDAPERTRNLDESNQALVDALAKRGHLARQIQQRHEQISAAHPEILKQDVARWRKSAAQLEKQHAERRDALMRLEVELQALGAQGLEERRANLARELAQARRRRDELQHRAQTLDTLLGLLRDKRSQLTHQLQAPLQSHLNHYLQLLFPQSSLEIDENLSPCGFTRPRGGDMETATFPELSFGAREQMGVLSRLAYADLLKAAGRPTLIILDDALVHSDATRLAQMKRLLFDAATRHQILIFTCHPGNWRDLGVGARSLETLRTTSATC